MAKEGTLLIVDDNRSILAALRLLLEKYFARVLTLPTPNRLATTLREEQIDVILLDMNFTAGINTGNEGIYWLGVSYSPVAAQRGGFLPLVGFPSGWCGGGLRTQERVCTTSL